MAPSPSNFYGQHLAQIYNNTGPGGNPGQPLTERDSPYYQRDQRQNGAPGPASSSTGYQSYPSSQGGPSTRPGQGFYNPSTAGGAPTSAFGGPQYPSYPTPSNSSNQYHAQPTPPQFPPPAPYAASSSSSSSYQPTTTSQYSNQPSYQTSPPPPLGAGQPQYPRSPSVPATSSSNSSYDSFGAPRDMFASSSYQRQNTQGDGRVGTGGGGYGMEAASMQRPNGGRQSAPGLEGTYTSQAQEQPFRQQSTWVPPPGASFSSGTDTSTPFLSRSQSAAFPSQTSRPQYPSASHSSSNNVSTYAEQSNGRLVDAYRPITSSESYSPDPNGYRRPSGGQQPSESYFNGSSTPSQRRPTVPYESLPARPSQSSPRIPVDTNTWAPAPTDAFYMPSPNSPNLNGSSATLRPQRSMDRAALVQKAVAEAAGGDWRGRLDWEDAPPITPVSRSSSIAASMSSQETGASGSVSTPVSSFSSHPPTRQPTITTTPPIPQTPTPLPAMRSSSTSSSQHSVSHPTFTRAPPSAHNLSPNSSFSAGGRRESSPLPTIDAGHGAHEFLNPSLLSNLAVFLKDRVPRGFNLKGALEHPDSFTGEQVVTTIQMALPKGTTPPDRRFALNIARSLQQSLWFHEVDWSDTPLKDDSLGQAVYMFDDKDDDDDFTEIPTGVLTSLTPCFSTSCGRLNEAGYPMQCYSYTCPNSARNTLLQRAPSLVSTPSAAVAETVEAAEDWVSSVPPAVVQSVDKKELQRQLVIFELVQTEKQYNRDLELIQKAFVEPLRVAQPPVIPPERLERFLSDVLLNVDEIQKFSRQLLDGLLARQRENYVVKAVGDLVLNAALDWGPAYLNYVSKFPLADAILKEEKAENPRFAAFVRTFADFSKDTRTGFETFHKRPPFRLLRYDLILTNIEKHSPENDPDRVSLARAKEVLKDLSQEANKASGMTENRVVCRNFQRNLVIKPGESSDLDLLNENRKCFQSGKVYRKADSAGFAEWTESFLILFDHYLVTCKPPRDKEGVVKYPLTRRPVPLELLQIRASSFTDPGVPRSQGFHLRSTRIDRTASENGTLAGAQDATTLIYPISLYQIGRSEGMLTFYVDSQIVRTNWEKKLREALDLRKSSQDAHRVVRLEVLSEQTFGTNALGSLVPSAPSSSQYGRPTCSVPLTFADGQSLVIAGCKAGLFVGFRGKEMRQVVHLTGITQCAVLQEFGFVLVLAEGALIAYSLEALIPSGRVIDAASKVPQHLSGKQPVLFFRVGKVQGDGKDAAPRTLVIYVKKGGVRESVFKALEPVSATDRAAGGHRFRPFGGGKNPEWFRTYKDFFLPSIVSSVQFMKTKVSVVLARGVEIMDLNNLRTMSVPNFTPHRQDPAIANLQRRCESATTLGMFRIHENIFLLAYNDLAFHVDKHGEPIPGRLGLIEWESRPEQVAYHAPYIYAFSPNLIEVRHATTGELAQVIQGSQIQLTYDGTGLDSGVLEVRHPSWTSQDPPEKRIQFSMRVGAYHTLYEIAPTVPLPPRSPSIWS